MKGFRRMLDAKIGFIGAGKMGSALIRGLIKAGIVSPQNVVASDLQAGAREKIAQEGVRVLAENKEVVKGASIIFLAVKPDAVFKVLEEIKEEVTPEHLVVSIAAGVPLEALEGALGQGVRVIRVMPNTPALIGEGASALFANGAAKNRLDEAKQIFSAVGRAVVVEEEGLRHAFWPGRLQVLRKRPLVICDAAHNASGAKVLAESLRAIGFR